MNPCVICQTHTKNQVPATCGGSQYGRDDKDVFMCEECFIICPCGKSLKVINTEGCVPKDLMFCSCGQYHNVPWRDLLWDKYEIRYRDNMPNLQIRKDQGYISLKWGYLSQNIVLSNMIRTPCRFCNDVIYGEAPLMFCKLGHLNKKDIPWRPVTTKTVYKGHNVYM